MVLGGGQFLFSELLLYYDHPLKQKLRALNFSRVALGEDVAVQVWNEGFGVLRLRFLGQGFSLLGCRVPLTEMCSGSAVSSWFRHIHDLIIQL